MNNQLNANQVAGLKESAVSLVGQIRTLAAEYDSLISTLNKHGIGLEPLGETNENELQYAIRLAAHLSKLEFEMRAKEDREDIMRYARNTDPVMNLRKPGIRTVTSKFFHGIADAIRG